MYAGLGVEPTTIATIGRGVWSVGSWIMGENPDTPEQWVERAYVGSLRAPGPGGVAQRTAPGIASELLTFWPSWREGQRTGPYDEAEVLAAIMAAPEGTRGDPVGAASRQGLVRAIVSENGIREPRNAQELARMAVYVASGRADGGVGWREEPAVAYLEAILRAYRSRQGGRIGDVVELGLEYGEAPGAPQAPAWLAPAALAAVVLLVSR